MRGKWHRRPADEPQHSRAGRAGHEEGEYEVRRERGMRVVIAAVLASLVLGIVPHGRLLAQEAAAQVTEERLTPLTARW